MSFKELLFKLDGGGRYLLNGTIDGNVACLDANYHKGLGPADVRKNRRRRTHILEEDMKIKKVSNTNGHQSGAVYSPDGISRTLCCTDWKAPVKIATNTKQGYDEAYPCDGVRLDHPEGKTGRGRVQSGGSGALSTGSDWGCLDESYRIRRLTPVECERLQAFPDDWTKYGKDGELISDTQRYKCIGNAVTTSVVTHIINEMFDRIYGVSDE